MVFFSGESNCFSSLLPCEEDEDLLEEAVVVPKEDSLQPFDVGVQLPESCIAHALGYTSPLDACRSAPVSKTFCAASVSNFVWERFLPPDYKSILDRAVIPVVEFSSKRKLFLCLCYRPVLIDDGSMSFWLWKSSGAKCFMISAKNLKIRLGYAPDYWRWISLEDSRFPEVAELVGIRFLSISGKINSGILSRNTNYAAFLVYKLIEEPYGLADEPLEATVKVGTQLTSAQIVCVDSDIGMMNSLQQQINGSNWPRPFNIWKSVLGVFGVEVDEEEEEAVEIPSKFPQARDDGWIEIELGEFYVKDIDHQVIKMSLKEMKGRRWKKGLLVQGIEIRPKA